MATINTYAACTESAVWHATRHTVLGEWPVGQRQREFAIKTMASAEQVNESER